MVAIMGQHTGTARVQKSTSNKWAKQVHATIPWICYVTDVIQNTVTGTLQLVCVLFFRTEGFLVEARP